MFGWMAGAVAVGMWYKPRRARHQVIYLTLVSGVFLVFLVIALAVMLFVNTQHGGRA